MKHISCILFLILSIACGNTKDTTKASNLYNYDSNKGKCFNAEGEEGYNPLSVKKARESKNCECMDLGEIDLITLLADVPKGQEFAYNELKKYNFRGANMSKAKIHFNYLIDCDFSGANMKDLSYGYAGINGKIDKFTIIPDSGCTPVENNQLDCMR